ncbi:MAG: LCP family protein [Kineosporiaceae bacterium]
MALLVLLLVGYPLALGATAWSGLNRVAVAASALPDTPGRTWLVVGSDARAELTPEERRRLHTGKAAGRRTDTIMLMHVPAGGGPVALVSIPRDSYVAIPGHGKNKINAAFAFGGPTLLARTVERTTGVRVEGYPETGLGGFATLVDALGGVDVCVAKGFSDAEAHVTVRAGCQTMDGPTALGYARARHSQARGDLDRVEHQRQVLAAIAHRTLSPSVLADPFTAFPVARAAAGALTVDEDASATDLVGFARGMRAVAGSGKGGVELTVPVASANLRTPSGLAVSWDTARSRAVFDALRADDTAALQQEAARQRTLTR